MTKKMIPVTYAEEALLLNNFLERKRILVVLKQTKLKYTLIPEPLLVDNIYQATERKQNKIKESQLPRNFEQFNAK